MVKLPSRRRIISGAKSWIQRAIRPTGFEFRNVSRFGVYPFADMASLISTEEPVIFDVGANEGQTIDAITQAFARATIHAFEPGQEPLSRLRVKVAALPKVTLHEYALGATSGTLPYYVNEFSVMSSLNPPGDSCWGELVDTRQVPVTTVDAVCEQLGLTTLDVLKIDVQGHDFEVLEGADGMLSAGRVALILMEITFDDMYEGIAPFDHVLAFMRERGYLLVTIYTVHHRQNIASWTDVMFMHEATAVYHGHPASGTEDP